ncbi:MAG TPA: CrcB family protein [Candidatus Saccharimonadales bacterium]|nr:CrcB family protein [Candidatus Saccharimonadales bacterium]
MANKRLSYDSHPELPLDPDVVQPGRYRWPIHLTPALQLAVFIGGCFGTLARYGVALRLPVQDGAWPAATFAVNMIGAFLLGFLLEALARAGKDKGRRRLIRLLVGTGFIGSFTTYSSLAVEIDLLSRNGHHMTAILYAWATIIFGLILSILGIQAASMYLKQRKKI